MHIYGELRPLPPGVVVAAQRDEVDGEPVILVAFSSDIDDGQPMTLSQHQEAMNMWLAAINKVLAAPEHDTQPVTVCRKLRLAS